MKSRKEGHHYFDKLHMQQIKSSGLEQFTYENLTWERALLFYKQENSFLKTRLSQVVDINTDKGFVEQAETFQNRFLFIDEYVKELGVDIKLQMDLLKESPPLNSIHEGGFYRMQEKLRREMERFEKDFTLLKNEFNKKLTNHFIEAN